MTRNLAIVGSTALDRLCFVDARTSVGQRRGRIVSSRKIFCLPGKIVPLLEGWGGFSMFFKVVCVINVNATYRTCVRLNDEVAENPERGPFAYEETAMFA